MAAISHPMHLETLHRWITEMPVKKDLKILAAIPLIAFDQDLAAICPPEKVEEWNVDTLCVNILAI